MVLLVASFLSIRPQTQVMSPNFYSCMNEEHTPINLLDSVQCRDNATIMSAAEDPEVSHPGASSSSKQTAASRVHTMLGSLGVSLCRQRPELAYRQLVPIWTENLLFQPFSVHIQKGREIEIKTSCIPREREKISRKSLNGMMTRLSEEREWLSKNCMKLRLKLR